MSDSQGWIKLHRKILDNPISRKPNYLAVWCYLLTRANHADNYVILNGEKKLIKEGEFIGSLLEISKHFKISISNISRIIKYLETETMLETIRTSKYTYFSIVNWERYQQVETKTENKEKTNGKQTETNNNVKNDKEYKFKGKVIRLIPKHYDEWKLEYPQLDLDKELARLDEYYFKQKTTNWFFPCKGALKKANENIAPKSNWNEIKNLNEEEKYGYSLND